VDHPLMMSLRRLYFHRSGYNAWIQDGEHCSPAGGTPVSVMRGR
jgi:hypothetical protein